MLSTFEKEERDLWFTLQGWSPHEAQARAISLYDNSRFTVLCCGRRWGKTELTSHIASFEAYSKTNVKIGLVGPTLRDAKRLFKAVWKQLVINGGYTPQPGSSEYNGILLLEWGAEITSISTDSITSDISSKGLGDSYDLLILDEFGKMSPAAWKDYLRPSLADTRGSAIFISTPWGYNHFYNLFILGQDDEDGIWSSMQSPTWENTAVFSGKDDPEIVEYKKNNSKESFLQNFGAAFTTQAGRVFSDFSRDTHVKKIKYESGWDTYISIDWGYNHPTVGVLQTGVIGGKPQVRLINEIEGSKITDEELLIKIRHMISSNNYNIKAFIGDSAGASVQSGLGYGPIEFFRRNGVNVQYKTDKLSKNIAAGLDHVRKYIMNAENSISFFVDEKCKCAIRSLEGYVYPEAKHGKAAKEEPVKDDIHDHFPDLIRYFMVWKYPLHAPTRILQVKRNY